jgi:hypothetical protein
MVSPDASKALKEALRCIRGVISDVASDPGGNWYNDGDDKTMECIEDILEQLLQENAQ